MSDFIYQHCQFFLGMGVSLMLYGLKEITAEWIKGLVTQVFNEREVKK